MAKVKIISVSSSLGVVSTAIEAETQNAVIEKILQQQSEIGWVTHAAVYDEDGDFYFVHADSDVDHAISDYIFD